MAGIIVLLNRAILRLFIAGNTARSQRAIGQLNGLCASLPQGLVEADVIDVLNEPERAEADRILATPTLLRVYPAPMKRLVGDFAHGVEVLRLLGVAEIPPLVM